MKYVQLFSVDKGKRSQEEIRHTRTHPITHVRTYGPCSAWLLVFCYVPPMHPCTLSFQALFLFISKCRALAGIPRDAHRFTNTQTHTLSAQHLAYGTAKDGERRHNAEAGWQRGETRGRGGERGRWRIETERRGCRRKRSEGKRMCERMMKGGMQEICREATRMRWQEQRRSESEGVCRWRGGGGRERGVTDGEGGEGSRRCQEGEEAQRGWLILH